MIHPLSQEQHRELLAYVRAVVRDELAKTRDAMPPKGFEAVKCGGAFVTLKNKGRLRGCIGTFTPLDTFLETVASSARSATHDGRFAHDPVTLGELDPIDVEVSILTVPREVSNSEEVEVGRHGIIVRRSGGLGGCFLPQVATEMNWTREEFLSNCCSHKAGLPADAWRRSDTKILVFEADVVSEAALGDPKSE